jgi:hypothetical protein
LSNSTSLVPEQIEDKEFSCRRGRGREPIQISSYLLADRNQWGPGLIEKKAPATPGIGKDEVG